MSRYLHPTEGAFARALQAEYERAMEAVKAEHQAVKAEYEARMRAWLDMQTWPGLTDLVDGEGWVDNTKIKPKLISYSDLVAHEEPTNAKMTWPMDSEGREIPQDGL